MKLLSIFVVVVSSRFCWAQGQMPALKGENAETKLAAVAAKVDALESEIEVLRKELVTAKATAETASNMGVQNIFSLMKLEPKTTADFDPAAVEAGYEHIDTGVGPMLVSIGKTESYLDGIRVQVQLGNILNGMYRGGKITAFWNHRRGDQEDILAWGKTQKTQDFTFRDDLLPGRWTFVYLVLPATRPEAFGWLHLIVGTNAFSLPSPAGAR